MQKYPKMVKNGQKWLFFWCFYEDEAKSFCDYLRLDFSSKNRKKTQKTRKNGPLAQGRGRIFVFFLALNARKKNPKKEVFFCCSFNQPLIRRAPPPGHAGVSGWVGYPSQGGPLGGGRGWALLRVLLANCIFLQFFGTGWECRAGTSFHRGRPALWFGNGSLCFCEHLPLAELGIWSLVPRRGVPFLGRPSGGAS